MKIVFNCSLEFTSLEEAKEFVKTQLGPPSYYKKYLCNADHHDEIWVYRPDSSKVDGFITFRNIPNLQ
jgi:hypothetical protein